MTRTTLLISLSILSFFCQNSKANEVAVLNSYVRDSLFLAKNTATTNFDSILRTKKFIVENEQTKEPIPGAILKLSDPKRHGVVFSYESDSLGQFQFDIKRDQKYYLRIHKKGFKAIEVKMAFPELEELKCLTLIRQNSRKNPIFAATNNQLLQIVSIDVISPLETYLCWLHPQKLNNSQIAGISHINTTPFKVLAFLSF